MRKILLFLLFFSSVASAPNVASAAANNNTVLWISIDGFRHDYLQRINPPTLSRLAHEGAWTHDEIPIFPSLTFPNHIAQVTGGAVDKTGIPMNSFLDTSTGKSYSFSDDESLFRAEPIWITARRQGVGVCIVDWPMSTEQSGPYQSDIHPDHFDTQRSDAARFQSLIADLQHAKNPRDLRLIMTYASHVDTVGHRRGPDSPEIDQAVLQVDSDIATLLGSFLKWFDATHTPDDQLYILITTDHGMYPVTSSVSLDRLIGADNVKNARIITSGPLASIYLSKLSPTDRAARTTAILSTLAAVPYAHAWPAADVPAKYHYADPTRIGDIVVLLDPGYTYSQLRVSASQPSRTERGMHGYDPVLPQMHGSAILWLYHHPQNGLDLGTIYNTQWHTAVATLLGIQLSPTAPPPPLPTLPQ
jgi:predicted AlkP superfamily pyrophosphatase or phosphodiesterase